MTEPSVPDILRDIVRAVRDVYDHLDVSDYGDYRVGLGLDAIMRDIDRLDGADVHVGQLRRFTRHRERLLVVTGAWSSTVGLLIPENSRPIVEDRVDRVFISAKSEIVREVAVQTMPPLGVDPPGTPTDDEVAYAVEHGERIRVEALEAAEASKREAFAKAWRAVLEADGAEVVEIVPTVRLDLVGATEVARPGYTPAGEHGGPVGSYEWLTTLQYAVRPRS